MKNIRKFELIADNDAAVLEEYSVSYVNEENKVYTTPKNGGQGDAGYSAMYTTFEALEDGTFSFTKNGTGDDIQYSKDNGSTWTSLASGETVSVVTGDKVMWKSTLTPHSSYGIGEFSSSNKFNVYGNVMSLLFGDDFNGQTSLEGKKGGLSRLFINCNNLIDASNLILPATTLAEHCYTQMFHSCTSLTTAPELPSTTLENFCYTYMFENCTSLTTAPELPATTLFNGCYQNMFEKCTSLTTAPSILPATTLDYYCYAYMFARCTSLTTSPILPATILATYCYQYMFSGCTSLNHITMLATDISATSCLKYWLSNVSLTGTFIKHPDMNSLPPTIDGIPNGWTVEDCINIPTECTSLTITADDVIGNNTTTNIHYTAICNGVDYKGDNVTGFIVEGTAVSAEFPQNTSETETVERTITFEFMGVTASTTITQGVWVNYSYTVDLNNQWQLSSAISNPDSTLYDGVYQSFSNRGVDDSSALMYIDIFGYSSFKFYVRSYAESNYDYLVVSNLDSTLTSETTSGSSVKMTTKGNQNSGTSIDSYQLVEFTGIDGKAHRITVMYRKDSSSKSGDDRGYVLIPKNQ